MTLQACQALFWSLVTQGAPSPASLALAQATPSLSSEERVAIYANMYLWRQIDALREDFPKLAAVLGSEAFYGLAEAYTRAHPSEHPSLSHFGRHLSSFLKTYPEPRWDLVDLAALEWARAQVFEDENQEPLSVAALAEVDSDGLAELSLSLVPAFRIIRARFDVLPVWKAVEEAASPPTPVEKPTCIAVWRKGFEVFHTSVPEDEARAIETAMAGAALGTVCESFSERPDPVAAAIEALGSWFNEGWIASMGGPQAAPERSG